MARAWAACLPALAVLASALALHAAGIGCPVRFATGIPCPGCGLTRAWLSALSLRLADAFAYHPLFPLAPVALAVGLRERAPGMRRARFAALCVLVGAFLTLWVLRLISPCDATLFLDPGAPTSAVPADVVHVAVPPWLAAWS